MSVLNFFKIENFLKDSRVHSLDTFRALSVLLGLLWHFMQISQNHSPSLNLILSTGPWGGANPLFLISGYLLGNQILARYSSNQNISLFRFYIRRALKTWPSYFALIIIFFSTPFFFNELPQASAFDFLFFIQNYNLTNSPLSHTWSLCIEEQFYLVLPFVSFLFLRNPKPIAVFISVLLVLLLGFLIRGGLWIYFLEYEMQEKFREYFNQIYYQTYCRLDGLVLGIFLCYLKNYLPKIWIKILNQGRHFFFVGLLLAAIGFLMQVHRTSLFSTLFVFPILSLAFGCFLISALSENSFFKRIRFPGVEIVATLSYALYLVHKPVLFIVENILKRFQLSFLTELVSSILFSYFLSFVCAYFLFIFFEKPFLKIRNRIVPSIERGI